MDSPSTREPLKAIVLAWLAATALSGIPSTLYAFAIGRDPWEATRAAAAMLPLSGRLFVDAALVHGSVSTFWAAILALFLPKQHMLSGAIVASLLIGILDLKIIAPRFFPEVAALAFWPQMADHLTWGVCFGGVLALRQKKIGL